MKSPCDRIAESELVVLKALWASGKAMSISELVSALSAVTHWDPSTIKTLVRRLHAKEVLVCEKREVLYYHPIVTEAEYGEYQTSKLIDTFYSGKASRLIAALYEQQQLDPEEVEELRKRLQGGKRT